MGKEKQQRRIVIPEDLFPKIAAGDHKALEELYYLTYRPLYAFLLNLTMKREDADDLLQETYIRIREAAHLYKEQGNPMAWIMKIAKNLFLMKKRKEHGKETIAMDHIYNSIENSWNNISQTEDRILLEQLFTELKDDEREIILLNVMVGMTFREISTIQKKPLGTILSKYHRAMKRLKTAGKKKQERSI